MKNKLFVLMIFVLLLVGCAQKVIQSDNPLLNTELVDVQNNAAFRLNDFKGKFILIENFAVWCPTCTAQQKEMGKLTKDNIVHISINFDPNEDIDIIKDHIKKNNFKWKFVVAPAEFTQELINTYGVGVVSAPSAPIIMICPDQTSRLLPSGLKLKEKLETEISQGCAQQ